MFSLIVLVLVGVLSIPVLIVANDKGEKPTSVSIPEILNPSTGFLDEPQTTVPFVDIENEEEGGITTNEIETTTLPLAKPSGFRAYGGGRGGGGGGGGDSNDNDNSNHNNHDGGPVCGNGVIESGEECDDGNAVSGDGCSSACEKEVLEDCDAKSVGYWKNHDGCSQGSGNSIWVEEIHTLSDSFFDVFVDIASSDICGLTTQNCGSDKLCKAKQMLLADELNTVSGHLQLDALIAGGDDGSSAFDNLGLDSFSTIEDALRKIEEIINNTNSSESLLGNAAYVAERIYTFYEDENPDYPECFYGCDDNNDCNDNNACTVDECVANDCTYTPIVCGDGLYCNGIETCDPQLGCQAGAPPDCSYLNSQCGVGVCNEATDSCVVDASNYPLSTRCEADGNLCTTDHCDGYGSCVKEDDVDCPAGDPCARYECNPRTGRCEADYAPYSTSCETDDNLCTNEHCDGTGHCVFLEEVDCPGDTECANFRCNPRTGLCDEYDEQLSTPCSSDNECEVNHCDGYGECVFNYGVDCDDNDKCTIDRCNSELGCQYERVNCDDGISCTIDRCDSELGCVNIPDDSLCPADTACADNYCDAQLGCQVSYEQYSTPCEADGNLCTTDHCDGYGSCVKEDDVDCPAGDPCARYECNPRTGRCEADYAPYSTSCETDDNLCTNEHCDGTGHCVFLEEVDCSYLDDQCNVGICNSRTGGCGTEPLSYSTPCNLDDKECTIDHCDGRGECVLLEDDCAVCGNGIIEDGEICELNGQWGGLPPKEFLCNENNTYRRCVDCDHYEYVNECRYYCTADIECNGLPPGTYLESCTEYGENYLQDYCDNNCLVKDNACEDDYRGCTSDPECDEFEPGTEGCDFICQPGDPFQGDAKVAQALPNANFGAGSILSIIPKLTGKDRSYIRLNINHLDSTVAEALLRLYIEMVGSNAIGTTIDAWYCPDHDFNELTITWFNQPIDANCEIVDSVTVTDGSPGAINDYDITTAVNTEIVFGDKEFTIVLINSEEGAGYTDNTRFVHYLSKEYSDADYRPKLIIS